MQFDDSYMFSFYLYCLLSVCLPALNTRSIDIPVHVCLLEYATWILRTRWVVFWQLWICMSRFWSLDLGEVLVANQNGAAEGWRHDSRSFWPITFSWLL